MTFEATWLELNNKAETFAGRVEWWHNIHATALVPIHMIVLQNASAPSDLQLPLRQWGPGSVYHLVLSKAKR